MRHKLAVIGLWGHEVYARTLIGHPRVELVAIAGYAPLGDAIAARLTQLRTDHPGVPYYADVAALLDRHEVDLAIVMTPPPLNPSVAGAALARGIHTICEKPVAGCFDDARALAAAWRSGGARFTACLPLSRFCSPFVEAGQRLAAGEIGEVTAVMFQYLACRGPLYCAKAPHYRDADVPPPALSGGEAAMFSGYGVLAIEAFAGARIATVQAGCTGAFYPYYRAQHIEDLAHVVMELDNGRPAEMTVGRTPTRRPTTDVGFLVCGEQGTIDWRQPRDGGPRPGSNEAFLDDFVSAVEEDREPGISGDDVFGTMSVLRAIYVSARLGEPVAVERV